MLRIFRRRISQEWWRKLEPVDRQKLLLWLGVEKDNEVLRGTMLVLRGLEEEAKLATDSPKQEPMETKFLAGVMSGLVEAQERLAKLVEDGRAARR